MFSIARKCIRVVGENKEINLESRERVALGAQVLQKAVYNFVLCCTNVAGCSNMLLAIKVAQMLRTDVRR